MKKVFVLLASLLITPFLQAAPAFKENENYEVIRQTTTPKPEVMEFFSITVRIVTNLSRSLLS